MRPVHDPTAEGDSSGETSAVPHATPPAGTPSTTGRARLEGVRFCDRLLIAAPIRRLCQGMIAVVMLIGSWLAASLWPSNPGDAIIAFLCGAILPALGLRLVQCPFEVVVDERTIRWHWMPFVRGHIDIDQVESIEVIEVRALRDFLGWGWQLMPNETGIIARSGPAVRIRRRGRRRSLVITTNDPEGLRHAAIGEAPD